MKKRLATTLAIATLLTGCSSEFDNFKPAQTAPDDTSVSVSTPQNNESTSESSEATSDSGTSSIASEPESTTTAAPKPETTTTAAPKPETTTTAAPKPETTTTAAPKPETTTTAALKPEAGGVTADDIASFYPSVSNDIILFSIGENHKASPLFNSDKYTFYSSDESVVTVDKNGLVTSVSKGVAYIKASWNNMSDKMYRYTIIPKDTIANKSDNITANDIAGFSFDDKDCERLEIGETHVLSESSTWLSIDGGKVYSSDESVVTTNDNGVVTAKGKGVAYVKVATSLGLSSMYLFIVS